MRVFVTGATGFIGSRVVRELLGHGHSVLGLTRSQAGAALLASLGAQAHHGQLEDLDSLRRGADACEATLHLGFIHDFAHFQENCAIDQRAIAAMGAVLAGSQRPLMVTSGTGGLAAPGQVATENLVIPPDFPFPRVSEKAAFAMLDQGLCASVMRLPQVHDTVKQGLVTYAIALAREKGVSAYIGEGRNRWAGARYHAVAEEGVSMRAIAEAIGRGLNIPVVSISPEEAQAHFGWLSMFASHDLPASSQITREKLGWQPTGPGLIADLDGMNYAA